MKIYMNTYRRGAEAQRFSQRKTIEERVFTLCFLCVSVSLRWIAAALTTTQTLSPSVAETPKEN
jgi:hypothetical protein